MTSSFDLPTLRGRSVELVALSVDLAPGLAAAAAGDRTTYGYTEVPDGPDAMAAYIGRLVGQRELGQAVPFAQRLVSSGRLVGCTRFLELRHWRGRAEPDEVEIGGTWLAADVQRTVVNTEAKLLMLEHAFERWGCWRVALCTDAGNARSRAAIERIGARFEGILRNHRLEVRPERSGRPRQTAMFSITDVEWPAVRDALTQRVAHTDVTIG